MWLYVIGLPLLLFLVIGGLLAGGVYTIVFLPIAAIIIAGAVLYTMWGRSARPADIPGEAERVEPLPHAHHSNVAAPPTTPDQLVDARREAQ